MNTGLLAFEAVARINRVDVDIRAIARQYGITGEPAPEELLRIAKSSGFRAKLKKLPLSKLAESYPLPAIAVDNSGVYRLVLKLDNAAGKLLLFNPAVNKTEETTIAEFEATSDRFIVLGSRAAASSAAFGFRWFLSEIITYKRIIGEVLLGSFVVQAFGLVTPTSLSYL
jgi:subfamily B ATP-binding cassette protein HlyB/CyaB